MRTHPAAVVAAPLAWGAAVASLNLTASAWAASAFQDDDVIFHPRSGLWQLSGIAATVIFFGFMLYVRDSKLARRAMAVILGGVWANTAAPFLWPAGVPDFIRSPFDQYTFFNTADVSLWAGVALFLVGAYLHLHAEARSSTQQQSRRRRR